ncbi:MAG: methylmalonyl-CoA decarboxylase [Akkermansia sp.]
MITTTTEDKVRFITMCNPRHLNALSNELCDELIDAIEKAYQKECACIVLQAECRNGVWSAGHDIRELPLDGSDPLAYDVALERLLRAVQNVPIPVIASITGSVWGGACDLTLSCDMIVAADTASFAITPAKIGIPYNSSGLMHFINQLGINKAREMFFTAQPISAQEALNVGLINHVAPMDELPSVLNEKMLAPIRRNSIMAISAIKRQFRILTSGLSHVSAENLELISMMRKRAYQSTDYREGVTSFIEKRQPVYTGKAQDLS